eukprot:1368615-Pyramimonas_sp.AAC.1
MFSYCPAWARHPWVLHRESSRTRAHHLDGDGLVDGVTDVDGDQLIDGVGHGRVFRTSVAERRQSHARSGG